VEKTGNKWQKLAKILVHEIALKILWPNYNAQCAANIRYKLKSTMFLAHDEHF